MWLLNYAGIKLNLYLSKGLFQYALTLRIILWNSTESQTQKISVWGWDGGVVVQQLCMHEKFQSDSNIK